MFTGIIESKALIALTAKAKACLRVRIEKPKGWKLKPGASVAVDGICSTVKKLGANYFEVEYMPETLKKTTAAAFKKNREVNLEKPLSLNGLLDGHLVQGHIDGRGKVSSLKTYGNSKVIEVKLPRELVKFVAKKGAVAVNGVSLTVAKKNADRFTVALIPYTLAKTNLGELKPGDEVNIEVDMLARYLAALINKA